MDHELTELAWDLRTLAESINYDVRDGYLDAAFVKSTRMEKKLDKIKERLNDLKYRQKESA